MDNQTSSLTCWIIYLGDEMKLNHLNVSLVKSILRIIAGACLCKAKVLILAFAGVLLIGAELLGILEELV